MSDPNSQADGDRRTLPDIVKNYATHFLQSCTRCGACFDICPMTRYSPSLKEAPAQEVLDGVHQILSGKQGSATALAWTGVCTKSETCVPACPEGLNPFIMLRVARMIGFGALGNAPQIERKDDVHYFPRIKAFAKTQLTEEEFASWME